MSLFNQFRPKNLYDEVILAREKDGIDFYNQYHDQFFERNCPACASQNVRDEFIKYGFSHKVCTNCGTLFVSPCPSDGILKEYYNNFTAPKLWTNLLLDANVERKKLQYQPRADYIISILKSLGHRKAVAVDLGAGSGAFALCLKESGFFSEVHTLDLSQDCVSVCREHGLIASYGSVDDLTDGRFDLICMNDLVEHLCSPHTFLQSCWRALRFNGCLLIATPNGNGFDFIIQKEHTKNITPPEHLQYFNPNSIEKLLREVGFENIILSTPGILDVEIVKQYIYKYNKNEMEYPLSNNEWVSFLFNQDVTTLDNFQQFLSENKLSSHMVVVAQKR
jgi:2-polyprenyl-3-methyl-5-hydroxy-6-metoxy-1,4-benzoquinol methylase